MKNTVTRGTVVMFLLIGVAFACKDKFLDVPPTGQLTNVNLNTKNGIEGLLISAYTELNGRGYSQTSSSTNWVYGSIMGGEANKGSNAGDFNAITPLMRYETLPSSGEVNQRWQCMYEGISRSNSVLRELKIAAPDVTSADRQRITGEARALRGHYYFELKRTFNMIPYVDESVDYAAGATTIPNNVDIWPKIEADFKYAYDSLPETQSAVGRVNKWAAASFLARVYLYEKKYTEAKALFDLIIANGKTAGGTKYALMTKYASAFNSANENNAEAIFSTQNAANTGSTDNASNDINLNFPYNTGPNGPAGCCGFFQPSFELANSFRTSATGLPLDVAQAGGAYDNASNELVTDEGVASTVAFTPDARPVDPRLDHSIGRRGIPYLDWQVHPGNDWIRDQSFGGPYSPKKYVYYKAQESTIADGTSWTKGWTGINYIIMRYSDLLLMAAEAEVEMGSLETARAYVNQVRARAANPDGFVVGADGKPSANYVITTYTTPWTDKTVARNAVYFERKLELSGEGQRFFDLVRWGIAAPTLNAYLTYEGSKLPNALGGAKFTPSKSEYLPIPQTQIDIQSKSVLTQNPGY